jgi:hypothetical protein
MRHFRLWKLFLGSRTRDQIYCRGGLLSISRCPVVQDLGEHCVKIELDEMQNTKPKKTRRDLKQRKLLGIYRLRYTVPVSHLVKDDSLAHLPIHPDAMVRTIVVTSVCLDAFANVLPCFLAPALLYGLAKGCKRHLAQGAW